jgi:hypothetical protein
VTTFRTHQDVAVVECGKGGEILEDRPYLYGTVTEAKPWSVRARLADEDVRLFLLDSRDRAWSEGGRRRLVPLCRCEKPILGEPVTDPDDPMGRLFCTGECRDGAAETAYEQRYAPGVAT